MKSDWIAVTPVSIVLVTIIATTIIDTSIVGIVSSSGGLTASARELGFFIYTVILFAVGQYIVLHYIPTGQFQKDNVISNMKKNPIDRIVSIAVYSLIAILTFTCLEILFTRSYHLIELKLVILISFGTSVFLLGILAWRLFTWLKFTLNINVFLYFLAICVICLNVGITIVYLNNEFSDNPEIIRPRRSLPGLFASPDVIYGTAYVATSVACFVLMWLATAVLLRNYSSKIAKIKFWILIVLPLAYFLGQFQPLFFYSFSDFRRADPISFGIMYTIIISASKPVGALLFGIAFWQTSKSIQNSTVKKYLIISAYGMTLLFTANQPLGLIFTPFPPFGLATVSYMILASYFILVGIYSSAISVANDNLLRRSIRKLVNQRSNLLDNIGTAQLKQQLESKILNQTRALSDKIETDTGIEPSLDENDLKHYIGIAIEEAKSRVVK